jgi:hypothetical protein
VLVLDPRTPRGGTPHNPTALSAPSSALGGGGTSRPFAARMMPRIVFSSSVVKGKCGNSDKSGQIARRDQHSPAGHRISRRACPRGRNAQRRAGDGRAGPRRLHRLEQRGAARGLDESCVAARSAIRRERVHRSCDRHRFPLCRWPRGDHQAAFPAMMIEPAAHRSSPADVAVAIAMLAIILYAGGRPPATARPFLILILKF